MCFSAEASFTVGTGIGVMGIATLRKLVSRSLIWIAMVPIFFAIQQYAEGVVWLHMNGEFKQTPFSEFAKFLYLFFAYIFWPTYIPLCLTMAERIEWRKKAIGLVLIGGFGVTLFNIYYLSTTPIEPAVIGQSIYYGGSRWDMRLLYGLAVMLPMFLTSIKNIWLIGIMVAVSFGLSQVIYNATFTSVWCFFAAIISFVLYFFLPDEKQERTSRLQ
jgi:hypothetical protein